MPHNIRIILLTALVLLTFSARAEKPAPFIFTPSEGAGPFPVAAHSRENNDAEL